MRHGKNPITRGLLLVIQNLYLLAASDGMVVGLVLRSQLKSRSSHRVWFVRHHHEIIPELSILVLLREANRFSDTSFTRLEHMTPAAIVPHIPTSVH